MERIFHILVIKDKMITFSQEFVTIMFEKVSNTVESRIKM